MAAMEVMSSQAHRQVGALMAFSEAELGFILRAVLADRGTVLQELVDWAVPDFAYGPARGLTDRREVGTIKSFNPQAGYGFITGPGIIQAYGKDVYLSSHQIGGYGPGDEVSFAILLNKGKLQAFDLGPADQHQGAGSFRGGAIAGHGGAIGMGAFGGGALSPWKADTDQSPGRCGGSKGSLRPSDWPGSGAGKGWGAKASHEMPWMAPKGTPALPSSPGSTVATGARSTKVEMVGVTDRRFKGHIKSCGKEYGFLVCSELVRHFDKEEIYVHAPNLDGFSVGDVVSFAVIVNEQWKPQAVELQWPVVEEPPRKRPREGGYNTIGGGQGVVTSKTKSVVEMRGVTDRRFAGSVKSRGREFGFVLCEDMLHIFGQSDIYVHTTNLQEFQVGDSVDFQVLVNEKGKPQAADLQPA